MTIPTVNTIKAPELDMEQSLVTSPSQADVDLFSSAMRPEAAQAPSHLSDQVASALSEQLGSTDKLSQQMMQTMKKVSSSKDPDPIEVAQMGRYMSQFSLEMSLTTKVVSKSTSALDKLLNLQ